MTAAKKTATRPGTEPGVRMQILFLVTLSSISAESLKGMRHRWDHFTDQGVAPAPLGPFVHDDIRAVTISQVHFSSEDCRAVNLPL